MVSVLLYSVIPFDLCGKWSGAKQRFSLACTILAVLVSPFSQLTFGRSFVADIFTSMPKIFTDLLFTGCIYSTQHYNPVGQFNPADALYCSDKTDWYKVAHIVLSVFPFVIRLMQSLRGFGTTRRMKHLMNALKYCSSIAVVSLSFGTKGHGPGLHSAWLAASVCSSLFAFGWDLFMDWGLGPRWLREALHGPQHGGISDSTFLRPTRKYATWCYYCAVVFNGAARCGWAIYISPDQKILAAHVVLWLGCVELFRRAVWAVFRLEWEDIHSCGVLKHDDCVGDDIENDLSQALATS